MMNQCDLMRKVMEADFAMVDVALYLDTHPDDTDMIATYKKLVSEYEQLKNDYEMHFGSICRDRYSATDTWTWNEGKMPWDGGVN